MESILPGSFLERTWKGKGFLDEASPKRTLHQESIRAERDSNPRHGCASAFKTDSFDHSDICPELKGHSFCIEKWNVQGVDVLQPPKHPCQRQRSMKGEILPARPPESKTPSTPWQRWNHRFLGWDSPPKMDLHPNPPHRPKECWHGLPLE